MCRKITKEKQQKKYSFKRDNHGFTLVEMVVTLVVLSIMLYTSIISPIGFFHSHRYHSIYSLRRFLSSSLSPKVDSALFQ